MALFTRYCGEVACLLACNLRVASRRRSRLRLAHARACLRRLSRFFRYCSRLRLRNSSGLAALRFRLYSICSDFRRAYLLLSSSLNRSGSLARSALRRAFSASRSSSDIAAYSARLTGFRQSRHREVRPFNFLLKNSVVAGFASPHLEQVLNCDSAHAAVLVSTAMAMPTSSLWLGLGRCFQHRSGPLNLYHLRLKK